jgi:hypothetical protein
MKPLLKIATALGVLTLAGCVVVPAHHYRPYGYTPAPPVYYGGVYYGGGYYDGRYYGPRRPRW